jgi:hydrolethalus syndrome protein 1
MAQVSKEYVRQQLNAMGVRELSEEDLEAYTNDFSRLMHEHLQEDSPGEASSGESFVSTNSSQFLSVQEEGFKEQAPHQPAYQYHRHSAVFKSFPGDKENRVYPLPASATPSPLRQPPHPLPTTTAASDSPAYQQGERNWDTQVAGKATAVRRKRKVLRKVNGESRVFEESYSSVGSVTSDLSELSLTSATSSEPDSPRGGRGPLRGSADHSAPHRTQCKSFIRPSTSQLYSRRLKKHDPVTRYHEWREIWQNENFPGEDNRNALRWQIREQMMHQDLPFFVPPRRPVKVNKYVVPTDKKRQALRWEIRHQMAQ